ncbi:helix-turn-helix transcriptional regulator [Peptococcaceae bacterium 1198_IL3148]
MQEPSLEGCIIKKTLLSSHYLKPSVYNSNPNTPGARLRKARIDKNMTIRDLATIAQIAPNNISLLETDKTKAKLHTLRRLSSALDAPVSYLGCFESLPEDTLGQRISKARHFHGLTKRELAATIGVNVKTLREWEQDKRQPLQRYIGQLKTYMAILKN